jgi:hypothetical protein
MARGRGGIVGGSSGKQEGGGGAWPAAGAGAGAMGANGLSSPKTALSEARAAHRPGPALARDLQGGDGSGDA